MSQPARRCLLAVFAHPDDETSAAAGTLIHYARAGVDIHVVVVFQKWRWPFLHWPSKGIAVDKQANDEVVHLYRF
jgi:hypothetical protein